MLFHTRVKGLPRIEEIADIRTYISGGAAKKNVSFPLPLLH